LLKNWRDAEVASFPTAINLQVIKLDCLEFAYGKQLKGVLQLLQKSPNLCELDIAEVSFVRQKPLYLPVVIFCFLYFLMVVHVFYFILFVVEL